MNACNEFDLLLTLHASGALAPAEAERVEAHLAACPACSAELGADRDALSLAALPPPSAAERSALADGPRSALAALHRADRRRTRLKRLSVGIALAAAVLLAAVGPSALRRSPEASPIAARSPDTAAVTVSWQSPDLDTLWDETDVLDLQATSSAYGNGDTTLATLDM